MAVGIYKTLFGGINTDSLINSAFLNLKISQFHMFCSNFSRVRMFCGDNSSKFVPESTQPGGFQSEPLSLT